MSAERGREGGEAGRGHEKGEAGRGREKGETGRGREEGGKTERAGESQYPQSTGRVHVRRLGVVDTLRWSWEVLVDRRELVGVAFAVNLLSVVATLGVSRPSSSATPELAGWVWGLYLVQFVAVLVAGGSFYLVAADRVANRSRPLARHLRTATKRLPALVGTAVMMGFLVGVSLIPLGGILAADWDAIGVASGLLLTLVFTLIGVYVFHRLLLAYPATVIDRTGPIVSVRQSWFAASGTVWKVFVLGVVYVVAAVASNVVSGVFGTRYDAVSTLVSAALGAILLPLFGLALAHLYLEGSRNR